MNRIHPISYEQRNSHRKRKELASRQGVTTLPALEGLARVASLEQFPARRTFASLSCPPPTIDAQLPFFYPWNRESSQVCSSHKCFYLLAYRPTDIPPPFNVKAQVKNLCSIRHSAFTSLLRKNLVYTYDLNSFLTQIYDFLIYL